MSVDTKKMTAPNMSEGVDESYKQLQKELERQEKQARMQQRVALIGDMARVFADAHGAKYGYGVDRRESTLTDKAMAHRDKLAQGKAAMQQQYAKDRAAAQRAQFDVDLAVERMNREAENVAKAQENKELDFYFRNKQAEQAQENEKARIEIAQQQEKRLQQQQKISSYGKNRNNYYQTYVEAVNSDPELKAWVDGILNENGQVVGQRKWIQADANTIKLIAEEYLRRKKNGVYNNTSKAEGKVKGRYTLVPNGRSEILNILRENSNKWGEYKEK